MSPTNRAVQTYRPRSRHVLPRAIAATLAVALAIGTSLVAGGCGDDPPTSRQEPAPEAIPVTLAPVARRTAAASVEVTGTLFGAEQATISAEVPGRVERIDRDVGDVVGEGGVLAQIEQVQYRLALDQKRAAMLESLASLGLTELPQDDFDPAQVPRVMKARREADNADARFRRAEQLWGQEPPLISEQDYSDLKTARDVARSDAEVALLDARATLAAARSRNVELALAEQRLDDTTVRAPTFERAPSGRAHTYSVAARLVSVGEYVAAGAPMFRLVAADPIKFRGDVPERFVDRVRGGQVATLRVDAFSEPFGGAVARINPQVNERSRTFQVEIEVPNGDGRLRPGAFGIASIVIGEDANVAFVPAEALVTFAGITKVFTVADGKAVEHRVSAGRRVGDLVEVLGAPTEFDSVVVTGGRRLATGTPVRVTTE